MNPNRHQRWLTAIRTYLVVMGAGNLVWEAAQFPLYTIWHDGTAGHIAFALFRGTAGDLLVAAVTLTMGLAFFGDGRWPGHAFWRVGIPAMLFGLAYTVYSEWLNVEVRHTWAYSDLMPTLPWLGTGLSPLLQWIAIPFLALDIARRQARRAGALRSFD